VALEDEGPPPIGTDVGVGVIGLETSVYCSGSRAFAGPYSSARAYMRAWDIPRLNLRLELCPVGSCVGLHTPT
jgi:hypothetical protein